MNDTISVIVTITGLVGLFGIFSFVAHALYLRKRWLPEVEILFHGRDFASQFLYFSILACIQYGGAFTSHFLAKRSKMLKAREVVPVNIQKHFIFSFWLFTISCTLFFSVGFFI